MTTTSSSRVLSARHIATPRRNLRRYLRGQGRRDGRKNIPDLENDGWNTPVLEELRSEAQHGLRMYGKHLWELLEPLDADLALAIEKAAQAADAFARAGEAATQAGEAADADEGAGTGPAGNDPGARLRRRSRATTRTRDRLEGEMKAAQSRVEEIRAGRAAQIERVREWAWAFVNMVRAAEAVYWAANLRVRRRAVTKRPEHVVFPDVDLPPWLTDDEAIDRTTLGG